MVGWLPARVLPAPRRPVVLEHFLLVVVAMAERKSLLSIFRRPDAGDVPAPWVPPELPASNHVPTTAQRDPEIIKPPASGPWVPATETPARRPRLVYAVDATASRSAAWEAAKKLQDKLFAAVPGELDVCLAVHGGNQVHTFTSFTADAMELRKLAARIRCRAGYTRLLDILARSLKTRASTVVYIGDVFEESERKALHLARLLKRNKTRVIILHDRDGQDADVEVFHAIAEITGGAVLPFDPSSLERLGELLEAVAVLAVGGVELVEEKRPSMPAAGLLLEHLGRKRIGGN
jgi:hypothetical protein